MSETKHGVSVIRYWPKFLSEKGNDLMLNRYIDTSNKIGLQISHLVPDIRLRRYCKWHQKQVKVAGEWKYQPRLVSWYGPCEYEVTHPYTLRRAAEWLALIVAQYPLRTLSLKLHPSLVWRTYNGEEPELGPRTS